MRQVATPLLQQVNNTAAFEQMHAHQADVRHHGGQLLRQVRSQCVHHLTACAALVWRQAMVQQGPLHLLLEADLSGWRLLRRRRWQRQLWAAGHCILTLCPQLPSAARVAKLILPAQRRGRDND